MKCPACEKELTRITVGNIEVDLCHSGCGGVWLDKDELVKFDEPFEFPSAPIFDVPRGPAMKLDPAKRKKCPCCADEVLVKQFIDIKNQVQIDQCWGCAGIWLDAGELAQIRSQYKTFEERKAAVDSYVQDCLRQHEAAMASDLKERLAKHDQEVSSRFKAFLHGFRTLLQGDEL